MGETLFCARHNQNEYPTIPNSKIENKNLIDKQIKLYKEREEIQLGYKNKVLLISLARSAWLVLFLTFVPFNDQRVRSSDVDYGMDVKFGTKVGQISPKLEKSSICSEI